MYFIEECNQILYCAIYTVIFHMLPYKVGDLSTNIRPSMGQMDITKLTIKSKQLSVDSKIY